MKRGSVWLSMGVLWAAYSLLFTGYAWVRGYDISFGQIVGPVNFYQGPWPPAPYTGTGVFPSGGSGGGNATTASQGAQATGGASTQVV